MSSKSSFGGWRYHLRTEQKPCRSSLLFLCDLLSEILLSKDAWSCPNPSLREPLSDAPYSLQHTEINPIESILLK